MFDPEDVYRWKEYCVGRELVTAEDYDKLLVLYLEAKAIIRQSYEETARARRCQPE